MRIPNDSTDRALHTNSNGRRTKRGRLNYFVAEINNGGSFMRMGRVHKLTTTWPPSYVRPQTQVTMDPLDIQNEFDKEIKFQQDLFKLPVNYNYQFNTGIDIPKRDTRFENFTFKTYIPPTPPPLRTSPIAYRALGAVMSSILVMIIIFACRRNKNRSRRGVVLLPAAGAGTVVAGAATVRPGMATNRRPSGQGGLPRVSTSQPSGPVPATSDLPPSYSECINKNVSVPPYITPPTYPLDTEPLVHNGLGEIGFRNDCVAMTTTPTNYENGKSELVFDNGRIVERSSLDLNKEAGQGTRQSYVKDGIVYVDERKTPTRK